MAPPLDPWSEPVERVLHGMMRQVSGAGILMCPEHSIEHTGKNAGAVVMACELAGLGVGEGERLFEFAKQQGLRIAGRLEREGESACWTFRPGRHDPFNCSNSVIDGGACSDALGTFLECFGDRLSQAERTLLERACVLHAQTYLRYAAFDKSIPAQRAWALTGVAQAYRQSKHEVLRYATAEGARELMELMHGDGSFSYHPLHGNPGHPGASDVSAFYQSRPTAFTMFALQAVGEDLTRPLWAEPLRKQLRFLASLYGPKGIKLGGIEAKPWYHGAEYEVASHPFDVFALARGARLFADAQLARAAVNSFRAWASHVDADGFPQSHKPGVGRHKSYQCVTFWAGHTQWMARAIKDLAWIEGEGLADTPEIGGPAVVLFEDAQLARLEDDRVVAWVRGSKPVNNLDHGSRRGGGLLRVVSKLTGEELLARDALALGDEAEWTRRVGIASLHRGWKLNREEIRFSIWKARNALRTRGVWAAGGEPWFVLKHGLLGGASNKASTAFACTAKLEALPMGVRLQTRLAHRGGNPVSDSRIQREYAVDGQGLLVRETVREGTLVPAKDYVVRLLAEHVSTQGAGLSFRLG